MRSATDLLDELNAVDESARIEAKRASDTGKSVMETVIAFANEPLAAAHAGTGGHALEDRDPITGMYCAVSFDDCETWPYLRAVSDGGPDRPIEAMDGRPCTMGPGKGEVNGYLTACQSADGNVHLISSTNHYAFNLAWLTEKPLANPIET